MGRIRTALDGLYPEVRYVPQTGSTMTDLMQAAHVQNGTVLLADAQSAGRGRLGRAWIAPKDTQVILSVLLLPHTLDYLGTLPLAAGLAVTDAIPGTVLKWPNDVLLGGKKLVGILAEAGPVGLAFHSSESTSPSHGTPAYDFDVHSATKQAFPAHDFPDHDPSVLEPADATKPLARVVVGMGINVALHKEELPVPTATSLVLAGREDDRTQVAIDVLTALHTRMSQWNVRDPQLLVDYRKVCSSIGLKVRLEAPAGDIVGVVESVGDDGRIKVDGEYYSAGDVIHLRPAR